MKTVFFDPVGVKFDENGKQVLNLKKGDRIGVYVKGKPRCTTVRCSPKGKLYVLADGRRYLTKLGKYRIFNVNGYSI